MSTTDELKYRYIRDRITDAVWQDIYNKWFDLADENGRGSEESHTSDLEFQHEDGRDTYILIWGDEKNISPIQKFLGKSGAEGKAVKEDAVLPAGEEILGGSTEQVPEASRSPMPKMRRVRG